MPDADDFTQILGPALRYDLAVGWRDKLALIFESSGEHKIVLIKAAMAAQLEWAGHLNFTSLIYWGNLSLPVLAWGLYRRMDSPGPLAFLPVLVLVFTPSAWESHLWATGALQNLPVLCLGFFAVALLQDASPRRRGLGAVLAVAATYTSANGMVAFVAALMLLASQRRYRDVLWVGTVAALAVWGYFQGFSRNEAPVPATGLGDYFRFFLNLAGGIAGYSLAKPVGMATLAGFAYLAWRRYDRVNPAIFGFGLFLLISMAAMTLGRAPFGEGAALVPRYTLYSGLLLAVNYIGLRQLHPNTWGLRGGVMVPAAVMVYLLLAYQASAAMLMAHLDLQASLGLRARDGWALFPRQFPETTHGNWLLDQAGNQGIFTASGPLAHELLSERLPASACRVQEMPTMRTIPDMAMSGKRHAYVKSALNFRGGNPEPVWVLRGAGGDHCFSAHRSVRNVVGVPVPERWDRRKWVASLLPMAGLSPGEYHLGLGYRDGAVWRVRFLGQTVRYTGN